MHSTNVRIWEVFMSSPEYNQTEPESTSFYKALVLDSERFFM
jgi:hypothetical protein